MYRIARDVERSRGQALAEMAIVAPVMLVLLLLAVDFGRLFFSYIAVNNAAREATYYASARAGDSSFDQTAYEFAVTQAALREAANQGQGGEGSVLVSTPTCFVPATGVAIGCDVAANFAAGIGNQVKVQVSQDFSFLTPIIGELFGGQVTLTASATAPVLNPTNVSILANASSTPNPTPTPTPTPTPAPTPTPTATPTLPPGATPIPTPIPTPTPTPTPTPPPTCVVPDFYHTYWNDIGALTVWHDEAGFTGTLTNNAGTKKIKYQTLTAGSTVLCSSSMIVGK